MDESPTTLAIFSQIKAESIDANPCLFPENNEHKRLGCFW